MSHAAYMLARLNAKNARFDVGSGGLPDLTPQDIAAAIAFVPAGLGRELLCHVYWPDGAAMTAAQLDRLLLNAQLEEWNRREQAIYAAMAKVATHNGSKELEQASKGYAKAHANRWPKWITRVEPFEVAQGWANLRRAVLVELAHPRGCPACHARGAKMTEKLLVKCDRCDGLGRVKFGATWRARSIGVKESTYHQTWEGPYEWLYRLAEDEKLAAEKQFTRSVA